MLLAGRGDLLPVSALPVDGTFPTDTAKVEKRSIAHEIPIWDPDICIECGLCALVCPHAAIRSKAYPRESLNGVPGRLPLQAVEGQGAAGPLDDDSSGTGRLHRLRRLRRRLSGQEQGSRQAQSDQHGAEAGAPRSRAGELRLLPRASRTGSDASQSRHGQGLAVARTAVRVLRRLCRLRRNTLFETDEPVLRRPRADRQRDRLLVDLRRQPADDALDAPTPTDADRPGPIRCSRTTPSSVWACVWPSDQKREYAEYLLRELAAVVGDDLVDGTARRAADGRSRNRASNANAWPQLRKRLADVDDPSADKLAAIADVLVNRSVWIVGGDGWAYDIGFGGLDHVLTTGRDVNILVLDTGVYSNTGGQASKATPRAAVAKFAAGGKPSRKKDLGMLAVSYGNVYVAQIAMGSNPAQTVRAFREAESYHGPVADSGLQPLHRPRHQHDDGA